MPMTEATVTRSSSAQPSRPYSTLGILVVAGIVLVILLGAVGASSPGLFDSRAAFFMTGGAILILAVACVYLFFTLSDALRILHLHEQRIPELQASRDASQDDRIRAVEQQLHAVAAFEERDPEAMRAVTALAAKVEDLERRVAAIGTLPSTADARQDAGLQRLEHRLAALEARPAAAAFAAPPAGAAVLAAPPPPDAPRAEPFGDVHPVVDVEGIGPAYEAKLKTLGIHDTRDLWRAEARVVAKEVGTSAAVVRQWQQMAELMAVKGLGKQYSEVLVKAGFGSIAELRQASPEEVVQRVAKAEAASPHRIQKNPVTERVAAGWVRMAREHRPAP